MSAKYTVPVLVSNVCRYGFKVGFIPFLNFGLFARCRTCCVVNKAKLDGAMIAISEWLDYIYLFANKVWSLVRTMSIILFIRVGSVTYWVKPLDIKN